MSNKYLSERSHLIGDLSSNSIYDSNKSFKICCICGFVFFMLLSVLAIPTIIMGAISPGNCDNTDKMGINVSQYLLGSGISFLIINLSIAVIFIVSFFGDVIFLIFFIPFILFAYSLFSFSWFIVGAVILFRSNIECINSASAHVIYALVLWCINAFFTLVCYGISFTFSID
jgi:hypothetical protein